MTPDERNTALIEVRGVSKQFNRGAVTAADNISFRIDRGGSLGLVGESGSGKTTVSRIVAGLERADSGEIWMNGNLLEYGRSHRQRMQRARIMQMVFQDPYQSLDPRQSAREALTEIATLHTSHRGANRARRVNEILDQVGLDAAAATRRPRDLSGGQRQRVAIARALAAEPQLLILDEAVAALDVSIQAQILRLLDEIRRETQVALLFVSHDLEVVRWITDDVLVMFRGVTMEHGSTETVLESPQSAYTKLLLASVPSLHWRPEKVSLARREFLRSQSVSA